MNEPTSQATMTRETHLRRIYIIGAEQRGRTAGLKMACSGTQCGGPTLFAAGINVAAVLAAADEHIAEMTRLGAQE